MKTSFPFWAIAALLGALLMGCDQTLAEFPDDLGGGAGSQCGDWYPGSGVEDGGESVFAVEEDATFPCLVWSSVRVDHVDTWFNAGELYLEALHGATDKRAIVMVLSGEGCPTCAALIDSMEVLKGEFESSAVMIGAALADNSLQLEPYTIDEAEEILIGHDGWPADWLLTNDEEGYLTGYESFPWVIVVRLSDMKVVVRSNLDYSAGNMDELLALVQSL